MTIISYIKLKFGLIVILLLFICYSKSIYASSVLIEDFNDTYSYPDFWNPSSNAGTISFQKNPGFIDLYSESTSFPYIETSNEVVFNDSFNLEIAFRYYGDVFNYGSAIVLSSNEKTVFAVRQDGAQFLRMATNVCPLNAECTTPNTFYQTSSINRDYHIVKIKYEDELYTVNFDGTEYYFDNSITQLIPNKIWFGENRTVSNPSYKWANLTINYISINGISFENNQSSTPLFILPGMLSCWNPSLINSNSIDAWTLFPLAKSTYNPIIKSLEQAGYERDNDFYVFCYDWRKPISQNAEKLNTFITDNGYTNTEVNLVGHSMGGLVARTFAQSNLVNVDKLIMSGSPHEGVAETYFLWSGGKNILTDKLQKHILDLYLSVVAPYDQVKYDEIRENIPSIRDLLPTYPFLVDVNNHSNVKGLELDSNKNNFLLELNNSSIFLPAESNIIYSSNYDTIDKLFITNFNEPYANYIHQGLLIWDGGMPISDPAYDLTNDPTAGSYLSYFPSYIFAEGDGKVVKHSAVYPNVNTHQISGDHGDTIKSNAAIQKIFELIGIDNSGIVTETAPMIEKMLSLILYSPANIKVTDEHGQTAGHLADENNLIPDVFYDPLAKIITIPNPTNNLQVQITGEDNIPDNSAYEFGVVFTDENNETKEYRFANTIDALEEKTVNINLENKFIIPTEPNHNFIYTSLLEKAEQIKKHIEESDTFSGPRKKVLGQSADKSIAYLKEYKNLYDKSKFKNAYIKLILVKHYLFRIQRTGYQFYKDDSLSLGKIVTSCLDEYSQLEILTLQKRGYIPTVKALSNKIKSLQNIIKIKEKQLEKKLDKNKEVFKYEAEVLLYAKKYLALAKANLNESIPTALSYQSFVHFYLLEF